MKNFDIKICNFVQLVRPGIPLFIAEFYAYCNTTNPYQNMLENVDLLISPINEKLELILSPHHGRCSSHPALLQVWST